MYLSAIVKGRVIENAFEIDRRLLVDQNKVYLIQDSVLTLTEVQPAYFNTQSAVVKGLPDNSLLMDESLADAFDGMKVRLN